MPSTIIAAIRYTIAVRGWPRTTASSPAAPSSTPLAVSAWMAQASRMSRLVAQGSALGSVLRSRIGHEGRG